METILNQNNFKAEVLESPIPVLVDFWATWCGPCRMMAPIVSELAEELAGKVKVCKVNVDEEQELAMAYRIDAIPTLIVFKNGAPANVSVGYSSKDAVLKMLE